MAAYAYAAYAKRKDGVTHADCWAHCRRGFERAKEAEPTASAEALALIGALYRHEQIIRERDLAAEKKLAYRTEHSEPSVHAFWAGAIANVIGRISCPPIRSPRR
jgi:hypothetical protein